MKMILLVSWASQKLIVRLGLEDRWTFVQLFHNRAKLSQVKDAMFRSVLLWQGQITSHTQGQGFQEGLQLHQHRGTMFLQITFLKKSKL